MKLKVSKEKREELWTKWGAEGKAVYHVDELDLLDDIELLEKELEAVTAYCERIGRWIAEFPMQPGRPILLLRECFEERKDRE